MCKRLMLIACVLIISNQFGDHCFAQDNDSLKILGSKYVAFTLMDLAKAYTDRQPSASIKVENVDPVDRFQSFLKQSCDALAYLDSWSKTREMRQRGKAWPSQKGLLVGELWPSLRTRKIRSMSFRWIRSRRSSQETALSPIYAT
jgi:hypothetical protein